MPPRPYTSVRAGLDNDDYLNVCDTYGGGPERREAWLDLGDQLAYRPGWHFDLVNDGEPLWSLGILGESRLNIHVNPEGKYSCYDHDEDTEVVCTSIPEVEGWLSNREDRAREPSPMLLELARTNDWSILKSHPHELRVSWSDGYYSASLPGLGEASFAATLKDAINGAAEMLCGLFGAPAALAPQLTLRAELDETAAAQVRAAD
jgi:hypothetical protein